MTTQYIYDLTDTWNAAGTVFTAIKMDVTDTASAAGSRLFDLQKGGVTQFNVDKAGNVGVGVAPSAWGGVGVPAIQNRSSSLFEYGNNNTMLASNFYFDGTNNRYFSSNFASYYQQYAGSHAWATAASGTAGAAISFTQAMTLDASGNLGIGQTSPAFTLDVYRGSGASLARFAGPEYSQAVFLGGAQSCYIQNWNSVSIMSTNGATPLAFGTNTVERMRIDSSGNVGIGTTTPVNDGGGTSKVLHINAAGANEWSVTRYTNGSTGSSSSNGFMVGNIGTTAYLLNYSSAPITFWTAATERMRLDASGDLLVGTTVSSARLTVTASSGDSANFANSVSYGSVLRLTATATGGKAWSIQSTANGDGTVGGGYFTIGNQTDATVPFRLSAAGQLGLGATPSVSYGRELTVADSLYARSSLGDKELNTNVGVGYLSFNAINTGAFTWQYDSSQAALRYEQVGGSTGEHQWFVAPVGTAGNAISFTQAMTLDASGNLAIGRTGITGAVRTESSRNANANYNLAFTTGSSSAQLALTDFSDVGTYANPAATLLFGSGSVGSAWSAISNVRTGSQSAALAFSTSNGSSNPYERMRIDNAGNVLINTDAVATNATDGFLYVPACAGTPTGTPTAYTGRVPIVVDTTNNKLYFYSNGVWRDAGP